MRLRMKIQMAIQIKLLVVVIAILAFCCQLSTNVSAEVDKSSLKLNRFKLRHVDQKVFARERATKPIVDLGWAARTLFQSFYSSNPIYRCPAYSYLFQLVKQQAIIRQDTIEALALVTNEDHLFYGALMNRDPQYKEETENFIEAMDAMGKDAFSVRKDSWETYLELVRCAAQFLGANTQDSNPRLHEYLHSNGKLQVALNCDDTSKLKVSSQVEQQTMKLDLEKFNEFKRDNLELARKLIRDIEIPEVKRFEKKLEAGQVSLRELEPAPLVDKLQSEAEAEDKAREEAMRMAELEAEAKEIELLDLDDATEQDKGQDDIAITGGQLMVLRLLAMRIMSFDAPRLRYERAPKIPMSSAIEFNGNWMLLEGAKLNPRTDIGAQGMTFRKNSDYKSVAQRVETSVEKYGQVTKLVGHLKELLSVKGKMTDLSEMRAAHAKLVELLNEIDPVFDVDDVRRMAADWGRKLTEYNTVQNFIDSESW